MTYIIKNIYSRFPNQSIFTRFLGIVLLTFTLLIGGSGNAWAEIVTATWNLKVSGYITTDIQNTTTSLTANVGAPLEMVVITGKLGAGNGSWSQFNEGTILRIPVVSTSDVVSAKIYIDDSRPANYVSIGGISMQQAEETYNVTSADVSRGYVEIKAVGNTYISHVGVTQNVTYPFSSNWDFTQSSYPEKIEGKKGYLFANSGDVRLMMEVDATSGKLEDHSSNSYVLAGTTFKIPVASTKDVITITNYSTNGNTYNAAYTIGSEVVDKLQTKTYSPSKAEVAQGYAVMKVTSNDGYICGIQVNQIEKEVITDPQLSVSVSSVNLFAVSYEASKTAEVTLTGSYLTDGVYNVTQPSVTGLSISPTSFTVTDGAVNQKFTISYTSDVDVVSASADFIFASAIADDKSVTVSATYGKRIQRTVEQATVSSAKVWDFTNAATENITLSGGTTPAYNEEFVYSNLAEVKRDETYNFDALVVKGQYAYYYGTSQVDMIKFNTSVEGNVTITFNAGTTSHTTELYVNGTATGATSADYNYVEKTVHVQAGDVVITGLTGGSGTQVRFSKIEFTPGSAPVYPITATWDFTDATSACLDAGNNQTSYPSDVAGVSMTVSYSGGEFKPRKEYHDVQINATTVIKIPVVTINDEITITNFDGGGDGSNNATYTLGGVTGIKAQIKTYSPTAAEVSAGEVVLTITGSGYMKKFQVIQKDPSGPIIPESVSSFELDFTGTGNANDIVSTKSTTGNASTFGISIDVNGNPVETSTNPHISFNTYYKNGTYGLWFANTGQSMSFDVDGPVTILLGMTDYNSNLVITDSDNTLLTTISLNNSAKFSSSSSNPDYVVTSYNYTGGATRLTLKCESSQIYIPYIKVLPYVDPSTRTFTDFKVNFRTNGYTMVSPSSLPSGVNISGTYHDNQHGYGKTTITVPVDGPTKFTFGNCGYNNSNATVKDASGNTIATINCKGVCDDGNTYKEYTEWVYNSYTPQTLTITTGDYIPYFYAERCDFVKKCTLTYYDTDGTTVVSSQNLQCNTPLAINKGAEDVTLDNKEFRGWFLSGAETAIKAKDGININSDVNLYARATDREVVGNSYLYDMTLPYFYPEDHELITITNGSYNNDHGWTFGADGKIAVEVDGKVTFAVVICQYSTAQTITVSDGKGWTKTISHTGGADTQDSFTYNGAGTLTMSFEARAYVHSINTTYIPVTDEDIAGTPPYDAEVSTKDELLYALSKASGNSRYKIFVRNGTYELGTTVNTQVKSYTTLVGESRDGVIIQNHPATEGIGYNSATLTVGSNVVMQNLTLHCIIDESAKTPQAERGTSLNDLGTGNIFKNIRLLGRQDTYFSDNSSTSYFEDCEIHGTVDFICGGGSVWFEKCSILLEDRASSVIVAPNNTSDKRGYTFNQCTIDNAEGADMAEKYFLARAWQNNPKCGFYQTNYNIAKPSVLWGADMTSGLTKEFNESSSAPTATKPSSVAIPAAPTNVTREGSNMTWTAVAGISKYAVYYGSTLIGIVTTNSFTIPSSSGAKGMRSNAPASDRYYVASISDGGLMSELANEYEFQGFIIDLTVNSPVLPEGVTQISYPQNGAGYNGGQNGGQWYAIQLAVDGPVDIYLGGCQYTGEGSKAYLTDGDGTKIADIDNRTIGCNEYALYHYTGSAGTLKLYCGQYCPSIRVIKSGKGNTDFVASWDWTKEPAALNKTIKYSEGWLESDVSDVAMYVGAVNGKLAVNGNNAQFTKNTVLYVPVYSPKDKITVIGWPELTAFSIHGVSYTSDAVDIAVTKADVDQGYIEIVSTADDKGNGYIKTVTLDHKVFVRTFTDFKIDFRSNPYTVVTPTTGLPDGVTFDGGSHHDAQHGYSNAVLTVPVDGPVKFTIGGCQFTNKATVSVDGGDPIDIDTKSPGCDNKIGEYNKNVVYTYNVEEAATLVFNLGNFCPYIIAEAIEYIPNVTVTYYDTDGTTIVGERTVEGSSALSYAYGGNDVTVPEGQVFRGWFSSTSVDATKVAEGTPINADLNLYAHATDREEVTEGSEFTYDLGKNYFYPEDHELIEISGGKYYNNHGWTFSSGGTIKLNVYKESYVLLGLCAYSTGGDITVKDAGNNVVCEPFSAKSSIDGDRVRIDYEGENDTELTITIPGSTQYIHSIKIVNKKYVEKGKVTFVNRYPKTILGTVPSPVVLDEENMAYIPFNTTLYRRGWAVTGWENAETGEVFGLDKLGMMHEFSGSATLYPVMTQSTKDITDTDHKLTVEWPFDQLDNAPMIKVHDSTSDPLTMTYVKGVDVEGSWVEVPLVIDASLGKADNTDSRVNAISGKGGQLNDNTVLTIPAVPGMTITLNASSKNDTEFGTTTNFTGDNHAVIKLLEGETEIPADNVEQKSITFTYTGDATTIDLFVEKAGSGRSWGFFTNLSVTYPVLPNVVIENWIMNPNPSAFPNEKAENAGTATVTLRTSASSHSNTGNRFKAGDVVTLQSIADYGYTPYTLVGFRKKLEDGTYEDILGSVYSETDEGNDVATADFTVPAEGGITTIQALFTRSSDLVKVTVTSIDKTKGMVSLSPKYENFYNQLENGVEAYYLSGDEVSASADATKDYIIEKWVDGTTEIPKRNVYTFNVESEKNIVAHFKLGAIGTVEFNLAGSGVHDEADPNAFNSAISIAPESQVGVRSFYIPNNYTIFKNGYTLTHWTDGNKKYELGKYYSFDEPDDPTIAPKITLTPVFTENIAGMENRTRGDELYWDFRTQNLVQTIDEEDAGRNFFWTSKVAVAVIEDGLRRDHTRDVALWVHTNSEGFVRNNDLPDWAAFGPGTTFDLPSCAGATIKMLSYSEITSTTFDGHVPVIDEAATRELRNNGEKGYVYAYTTTNPNPRVTITIGDDYSFYKWIKCYTLPANMVELHMDVDNDTHGEILSIVGTTASEAKELADGGFAFQQGNKVNITFKRKFGYKFDKIIDINRKDTEGNDMAIIEVVYDDDDSNVIRAVKMVMKDSDERETINTPESDGTWKNDVFTFRQLPAEDGERESYELSFEITTHRTIVVYYKEKPTYYITYNTGPDAVGTAPAAEWVEAGDKYVIPRNNTLYYEGNTLKAWRTDDSQYDIGTTHTAPASDLRFFPVFEKNKFTPLQVETPTKVTWNFTRREGAPTIVYERSSGIYVAQLEKGGEFIDLKIDLDASEWLDENGEWQLDGKGNVIAGKFNNTSYDDRCQVNEHSIITFPATTGCEIELTATESFPSAVKIAGAAPVASGKTISTTYSLGCVDHTVTFADDGADGAYNTWCTSFAITYNPVAVASLPELSSVDYGGTPAEGKEGQTGYKPPVHGDYLTSAQLTDLKNDKEVNVGFTVGDDDTFPYVMAGANNGYTSVSQADFNNRTAIISLYTNGGVIMETYNVNFIPEVHTPPTLLPAPSIYVNTTGYNSTVPPLDQPINGTISIMFNRTMQPVTSDANITLAGDATSRDALTAKQGTTLIFRYWNLNVNTEYTMTIPKKTLKDVYGGVYNDDITVTFTTAENVIPVEHRKFNWIVGVDGTLSEGINAANNASGQERFYIFVPDGEYELEGNENIMVSTNNDATTLYDEDGRYRGDLLGTSFDNNKTQIYRPNVSLIGQSMTGTQIYNKPVIEGIGYTATIHLPNTATDFYAQDLTLENRLDYRKAMEKSRENPKISAARGVVLQGHASRTIMKNVALWSYQDTYYSSNVENDPSFCGYFENCTFAGVVDWACGGGNIWWEKCNIVHRDRSGNNFAAPHTTANQEWGYVFNDCVIKPEVDESELQNMTGKDWSLARPWGSAPAQSPACTFLNTTITLPPRDAGWGIMYGGMVLRFHEYKTKDADGNLVSLGTRSLAASAPAAGSDDYILSDAEAARYKKTDVLEFDPKEYTSLRPAVTNLSIEDGVLSWDANADGMDLCYFIFKKDADGKWKYYANVAVDSPSETPSLDFNTFGEDIREGFYMIRTANQRGGLGEPSKEIEYKEAERFDLTITEVGQTPGKGWSTICLPNNAKVPTGDIKVYAAVSINDNIITLKSVDFVNANVGYVIYGDAGTYTFRGSTHTAKYKSYLSGNSSAAKVSASTTNCYTLAYKPNVSGIGFYKYSGTWLNPYKAYLDVEVFKQYNTSDIDENALLSKSLSKGIRFVFAPDDDATDLPLLDLNATITYETDAIYDLAGRRIITPVPGRIYIINGTQTLWE